MFLNRLHFLVLGFSVIFFVIFADFAFCSDLPITLKQIGETYLVKNTGECVIYKLKVKTIPPKKEGIGSFISRVGASIAGIGSFTTSLGKVEPGEVLDFERSDLTNNDGKKLTNEYVVGYLRFEGSTCGESGLNVVFNAD